jgi:hypothetical protein
VPTDASKTRPPSSLRHWHNISMYFPTCNTAKTMDIRIFMCGMVIFQPSTYLFMLLHAPLALNLHPFHVLDHSSAKFNHPYSPYPIPHYSAHSLQSLFKTRYYSYPLSPSPVGHSFTPFVLGSDFVLQKPKSLSTSSQLQSLPTPTIAALPTSDMDLIIQDMIVEACFASMYPYSDGFDPSP